MHSSRPLALTLALTGCTAVTGAGDFKVDDTAFPRDLDYTFEAMQPHAAVPMEVAVVDELGFAQARARIYLPPRPARCDYPDVRLTMERALWKGDYDLYFFIDGNPENYLLDTDDAARTKVKDNEHPWIERVPASGVGSFSHSTNFRIFDTAELNTLGKSVVLQLPGLDSSSSAIRECLLGLISSSITKERIEVRVFLDEGDGTRRQMGTLIAYKGVPLPNEVRLEGIVDVGSNYTVEIDRGDETQSITFESVEDDIQISSQEWLGISLAAAAKCRQL
jgi:hypothetical protein